MTKTKLLFDGAAVERLLDHTLGAPGQMENYGRKIAAPALLLVKDQGVYLMSNGTPADIVKPLAGGDKRYVVYAEGFDPSAPFDEWYHDMQAQLGGDDFAEPLDVAALFAPWREYARQEGMYYTLTVSSRSIGVTIQRKAARRKKAS